jgi:polyisoprenoid-binding protein YceI
MKERFELDKAHTAIGFSAKHLGVSTVRGSFDQFEGYFEADREDLSTATGEVTIQVASISTKTEQRDAHLRSADFFEAEKYPTMTFKLTGIREQDSQTYRVEGELTIKETTRPIALEAVFEGETPDPTGSGGTRIGVSALGQVNRMDFGLNWDGLAGAVPFASHTIRLQIDAELIATPVAAEVGA